MSFENRTRIASRPLNHFRIDAAERDLQAPAPFRAGLPCECSNADVDEAGLGWSLDKLTKQIWRSAFGYGDRSRSELEVQVAIPRSLFLHDLVLAAFPLLQSEVDAGGRFLQHDSKFQLTIHSLLLRTAMRT